MKPKRTQDPGKEEDSGPTKMETLLEKYFASDSNVELWKI